MEFFWRGNVTKPSPFCKYILVNQLSSIQIHLFCSLKGVGVMLLSLQPQGEKVKGLGYCFKFGWAFQDPSLKRGLIVFNLRGHLLSSPRANFPFFPFLRNPPPLQSNSLNEKPQTHEEPPPFHFSARPITNCSPSLLSRIVNPSKTSGLKKEGLKK